VKTSQANGWEEPLLVLAEMLPDLITLVTAMEDETFLKHGELGYSLPSFASSSLGLAR
jgi:hypothetical protein